MARRFLFSTTNGTGHVHPLVPLARALQQAGHEVVFAARPPLHPMLRASGFTVLTVTGDLADDQEYQQVKARLATIPLDLAAEVFSYPRLFGGIPARVRTPVLVALLRAWGPDMVIREAGEYSAALAAEHLGLPHATVAFAANLPGMAIFERELPTQLAATRQHWGLAPDPTLTALYRYLHLAYAPPSFSLQAVGGAAAAEAIPATTHFIRPDVFDRSGQETLPAWIAELPAQPTVYATLGTEVNKEPELYPSVLQTIIAGLRDAPINLIVTLGRGQDPAEFGPQPANVHIEPYIPQSLLLPHCDLMVMHGGSNSLLAALDIGLPVVVVPLIADQFFNAEATERIGLGPVVQREQLTPARLRAALDDALANPRYRQTAQRLQAEMHALPGQSVAVDLLEQVAATRQPVPNMTLPIPP